MAEEIVTISISRYDKLKEDSFALEQAESTIHNLMAFNERLEKAVIEHIAEATRGGKYDWKLNSEFADLISILNLHEYDWSKHYSEEMEEDE